MSQWFARSPDLGLDLVRADRWDAVRMRRRLTIFNSGGYWSSHPAPGELCRRHEVSRWRRPGRGGAGPPGAGAAGRGGDDRGRGQRPGDREAVPGVADEREPVAAGAGGGRPGGAGLQGRGRREVQADRGAGRRAGGGAGRRARRPRATWISAGRWRGSRIRSGGGSGWSTRWPGWTCCCTGSGGRVQVPARRAAERDEEKIARWREDTWPVIKARRRTWAPGSASKTSPARA